MKQAKLPKGTSIIEIVIAAALISVAVIAALSLSNNSQKQNTYARFLTLVSMLPRFVNAFGFQA